MSFRDDRDMRQAIECVGGHELNGRFLAIFENKGASRKELLFPHLSSKERADIKLDQVAEYSVSDQAAADVLSRIMLCLVPASSTVLDANACVGGNVLSFASYFECVYAVEIEEQRYEYLLHNVRVMGVEDKVACVQSDFLHMLASPPRFAPASSTSAPSRVHNGNSSEKVAVVLSDVDAVFFDPPWGGPEYRVLDKVDLFLSGESMACIVHRLMTPAKRAVVLTTNAADTSRSDITDDAVSMNICHSGNNKDNKDRDNDEDKAKKCPRPKVIVIKVPNNFDVDKFIVDLVKMEREELCNNTLGHEDMHINAAYIVFPKMCYVVLDFQMNSDCFSAALAKMPVRRKEGGSIKLCVIPFHTQEGGTSKAFNDDNDNNMNNKDRVCSGDDDDDDKKRAIKIDDGRVDCAWVSIKDGEWKSPTIGGEGRSESGRDKRGDRRPRQITLSSKRRVEKRDDNRADRDRGMMPGYEHRNSRRYYNDHQHQHQNALQPPHQQHYYLPQHQHQHPHRQSYAPPHLRDTRTHPYRKNAGREKSREKRGFDQFGQPI